LLGDHDFMQYRVHGLETHLTAFPTARQLPYARASKIRLAEEQSSMAQYWWDKVVTLIAPFGPVEAAQLPESVGKTTTELALIVGERLWTDEIVRDYETGKRLFHTPNVEK